MSALDLDYLDSQHIELNDIDKSTGEWIPPDGQRSRRCTELYCTCCRKHLERATLAAHVESSKHQNWIAYEAEQKATACAAAKRKSVMIAPPPPDKKIRAGNITPPCSPPDIPEEPRAPPPTKIPDRDPTMPRMFNNMPALPRRQGLASKAGLPSKPSVRRPPSVQSIRSDTTADKDNTIKFVPEGAQLDLINQQVQTALKQVADSFLPLPPFPPVPPKMHPPPNPPPELPALHHRSNGTPPEVQIATIAPKATVEVPKIHLDDQPRVISPRSVPIIIKDTEFNPQPTWIMNPPLQFLPTSNAMAQYNNVQPNWNQSPMVMPMIQPMWQQFPMFHNNVQYVPPQTISGPVPSSSINAQIVYNQQGRPMLLTPL